MKCFLPSLTSLNTNKFDFPRQTQNNRLTIDRTLTGTSVTLRKGKGYIRAHQKGVAQQAVAYLGFCSMKGLEIFRLLPGWDASTLQGNPQHSICHLGGKRVGWCSSPGWSEYCILGQDTTLTVPLSTQVTHRYSLK